MKAQTTILLVDDDPGIAEQLVPFLKGFDFAVVVADDGEEALHHVEIYAPDLIVLDIRMPKVNGHEVLRRLRQAGNDTPVILLSEVGDAVWHTRSLDEGADDYLNKPFDAHELRARIQAVLRRVRSNQQFVTARKLSSGELHLDKLAHKVWLGTRELPLSPKAVDLLGYLMSYPGELFKSEQLLDTLWGWGGGRDDPAGTSALRTRIAELRRALKDDPAQPRYIETQRGGYRFIGKVEVEA
jgi:DNA-binding response OmpR family regulator